MHSAQSCRSNSQWKRN